MLLSKGEAWNIYSENYNFLVERLIGAGIDISLLDDVIIAHEKALDGKNNNTSYQSRYQSQHKNTV